MNAVYKRMDIGDKVISRGRQMTEADVRILIASSGSDHPLHTDPIFCREKMHFEAPIVQGCLVIGVADAFFNESVFTGADVVLTYGYEKIRFIRPTHLNDVLQAQFELVSKSTKENGNELLKFNVTLNNQNHETVFFAVEEFCVLPVDMAGEE